MNACMKTFFSLPSSREVAKLRVCMCMCAVATGSVGSAVERDARAGTTTTTTTSGGGSVSLVHSHIPVLSRPVPSRPLTLTLTVRSFD